MPSGLDGNPNPIVTPERKRVLDAVADLVSKHPGPRTLVGVDGQSGAGKSTFADELGLRLAERDVATVRSTTDSFHRPRTERLQRGSTSAEGYYLDSHQLAVIVDEVFVPFKAGSRKVRTAAFDEPSDSPVEEFATIPATAVMLFDGLFLLRPEFRSYWDITVFLDAASRRDAEWLGFVLGDLPSDAVQAASAVDDRLARARWPRYRDGWRTYVEAAQPGQEATVVIDNNDLRSPTIVTGD